MRSKRLDRAESLVLTTLAAIAVVTLGEAVAQQGSEAPSPPGSAFGELVEVNLVTIDVWVSDREGRPVRGLEAASFELSHDGQPVRLAQFEEVRQGEVVGERPAPIPTNDADGRGPTTQPSHLVLYFDDSRLHPSHLKPLVSGLESLLEAGAVDPERVLIVRQDRSLSVEAPFGSSLADLRQTLRRLAAGDPRGLAYENETRLALDSIRVAWRESERLAGSAAGGVSLIPDVAGPTGDSPTAGGGAGGGDPRSRVGGVGSGGGPAGCGLFVSQIRPTLDAWSRSRSQRMAITLSRLSDLVSFLAGLPGLKTLVYLSDGLDTQPGVALANYASGLCPSAGAELLRAGNLENLTDSFLTLTRHANTNRVTLHAVQASGLRTARTGSVGSEGGAGGARGQQSLGSFESTERASARHGMTLIADETGGAAVFDRNEFGPALMAIGEASRNYYTLAYEPPATDDDQRQSHRIEVKVRDGSLEARYRRGYLQKDSNRWLNERIEGALNLGITSNPLGVRLGAGEVQAGGESAPRVPLHVMVPVERLAFLPEAGEMVAEVAVRVMSRDIGKGTLAIKNQSYRLKGAPGATGLANLPIVLELAEGRHLTAVGIQDRASGEASFVTTLLDSSSGS